MSDIFGKCRTFTTAKELIDAGIYPYFKELEREAALIYATSYQMNLGVISAIVGKRDVANPSFTSNAKYYTR